MNVVNIGMHAILRNARIPPSGLHLYLCLDVCSQSHMIRIRDYAIFCCCEA